MGFSDAFAMAAARMVQPDDAKIYGSELTRIGLLQRAVNAELMAALYGNAAGVWEGFTLSATGSDMVSHCAAGTGLDGNGFPIVVPASIPTGGHTPSVTHAHGDATHPRIDTIYLRSAEIDFDAVNTPTLASQTSNPSWQTLFHTKLYHFTIGVVAGTPAGSPVAPAVPLATDLLIGQVAIAANATTINGGNQTDERTIYPTVEAAISGAVASTSANGNVRLSHASGTPSTPVVVETADPRMLTTGEADAAAGSYGTPGSSNKFMTSTDPRVAISGSTGASVISGGAKIQSGQTGSLSGSAFISFGAAFASPPAVTVIPVKAALDAAPVIVQLNGGVGAITTTGATVYICDAAGSPVAANYGLSWIAVGF